MQTPTIFSLICYRPNGDDYCRGCLMGRSDSAMEILTFTDPAEAAKKWSEFRMLDKNSEREYFDWEITLLINGKTEDFFYNYDEGDEVMLATFASISNQAHDEYKRLCELEADEVKRQEQLKADAEERDRIKKEAKKAANERAEYLRLRQMFENC